MTMTVEIPERKVTIWINPLNHYEISDKDLINSCGFLPLWAVDPDYLDQPIKQAMTELYGFGKLYEMKGGEVTDKGVYKYPDDPDLYPIVTIKRDHEIMHQYPYGIVAFEQDDGTVFVTRMD